MAVVIMLAIIGTTAADFAYNSTVDLTSAINGRDELRAHYFSRSAINMARLIMRVQQRQGKLLGNIQLADFAPQLVAAFASEGGAQFLGGLLGVDTEQMKGMGIKNGAFDLQMESLDGKVNINCAGGANPGAPAVARIAASLAALMMPERYNRLFEQPDQDGQYHDRLAVLRAIVDWADQDQQLFGSTAPEDYRYDTGDDKYETKDQYYDSLEELRLVRGIGEDFMSAFGRQLTVYGPCKVDVSLADVPLITALILQYAASPSDPGLQPRNIALLARYVHAIGQMRGGFSAVKDFVQAVEDPAGQLAMASLVDSVTGQMAGTDGNQQDMGGLPPVTGVKLDGKISESISESGERRIWRVTASAEAGRVRKRITAVWDQTLVSMHAGHEGGGPGGFVYWRED